MRPTRSNLGFADRLRNYSRMVSNKLELSRHSAMNMAGLSAAAGAALSAHHSAEAAITYSGPINQTAIASFTFANAYRRFDFSIDGLANFGLSAAWFPYNSIYGLRQVGFGTTGATANQPVGTATPGPLGEEIVWAPGFQNAPQPDKLAQGAVIDANSPFFAPGINPGNGNKALIQAGNYGNFLSGNNWPNPAYPNSYTGTNPYAVGATVSGFAGIRFDAAGGEGKHYGWVRLKLTNTAAGGFTPGGQVSQVELIDWAYETTPDMAIMAGDGISAPDAGDFDSDGDVDGADFLQWQRTDGTPGGLTDWQNTYGNVAPLGAASSVPEPGSAALMTLGLLATGAAAARWQRKDKQY